MSSVRLRRHGLTAVLGLFVLAALESCGGGKPGNRTSESAVDGARAALESVEYGRLVDVYAWRRRFEDDADRIDPRKREPVLVRRNVLVHPLLRDENPITNGQARFRFLPYTPSVGHRELLVLFDDLLERDAFDLAMTQATSGIPLIDAHFAFAKGIPKQPPVVPRDATLRLKFDRKLGLDQDYFDATPGLVQVLQLAGDPDVLGTSRAYTPIPSHVLVESGGRALLVDLEVSGREAIGRVANPHGLPAALDVSSANIRLALPTTGPAAERFRVRIDKVEQLNGRGMNGATAVIRDFRSGHPTEAARGALPSTEAPRLTARKLMGLLAVDAETRMIVVHKRDADVVLRPRIPFVDGPYSTLDGRPLGPAYVPQGRALLSGDVIRQDVVSPHTGEVLTVHAQVLENLAIPAREGDPALGSGSAKDVARLVVDTLVAYDSAGHAVSFEAVDEGTGKDCTAVVHYCDELIVGTNNVDVGDRGRLAEFLELVPEPPRFDQHGTPLPINENIDPFATVTMHFSVPVALDTVRSENNFVLANELGAEPRFVEHPKTGCLAVVPTSVTDLHNDGTSVRLDTPLGLYHEQGTTEAYYVHLFDGDFGIRGSSGEPLELHEGQSGVEAITAKLVLAKTAPSNHVGSFLARMDRIDENGTSDTSSSPDYFGQYQIRDGKMHGLPGQRFSRVFDPVRMATIQNDHSRRCAPGPSFLYTQPILGSGIVEPFVSEGSRMQQSYREVDFGLSYSDPVEMEIDIEQLHWAPFLARTPSKLTFDLFDRVSMTLGHSEKRPDNRVLPTCASELGTALNGLELVFEDNYLDNSLRAEVVKDVSYTIDPNNAFAAATGTTMISYPRFQETFTFRDRRVMSIDGNGAVVGLGGSKRPNDGSSPDRTRDVTSPHIPEVDPDVDGANARQDDDYKGDRVQDLAPFALPLLVDFAVHPDDAANGKVIADNLFQVGILGAGTNVRVHSTGGIDGQLQEIIVDPTNAPIANGGWIGGAGNSVLVPPGDSVAYWAQADFVRKVSVVTSGYFDTLLPGRNAVQGPDGWPANPRGYPDLEKLGPTFGAAEFAVLLDPRPEDLPLGTQVIVEYRAASSFERSSDPYEFSSTETAASRNNLLNPHYACEQYRYLASGRVDARGVTAYALDIDDLIDARTEVAPRFLNFRITFVGDVDVVPTRTPYVGRLAIVWRVKEAK
ncbi:MAG: hypothetical protein KDC95_10505 [Planctomycetes bacterium]|nr:hypothetical protein [Planctomycetota bacterium]